MGRECCSKGSKTEEAGRDENNNLCQSLSTVKVSMGINRRKGNKKVSDKFHGAQVAALRREAGRKQMFELENKT